MSEADELCDRIAVMDEGRIAVSGSPSDLKRTVGSDVISVKFSRPSEPLAIPENMGLVSHQDSEIVQIRVDNAETSMPRIMNYLLSRQVPVASVSTSKPTLDDVFMKYTKRTLRESDAFHQARATRRTFMRRTR